jgi:hypothetical protein
MGKNFREGAFEKAGSKGQFAEGSKVLWHGKEWKVVCYDSEQGRYFLTRNRRTDFNDLATRESRWAKAEDLASMK